MIIYLLMSTHCLRNVGSRKTMYAKPLQGAVYPRIIKTSLFPLVVDPSGEFWRWVEEQDFREAETGGGGDVLWILR